MLRKRKHAYNVSSVGPCDTFPFWFILKENNPGKCFLFLLINQGQTL